MSEAHPENPNGGSMSPEEFMRAEMIVDTELEKFCLEDVPYVDVKFNGQDRRLHPFNTSVIVYEYPEATMWDHVLHQHGNGEFLFYNEMGERARMIADLILKKDFPLLLHYERPHPNVMERFYEMIRGTETMATILQDVIDYEEGFEES